MYNMTTEEEKLKEENKRLRKALAVCLNEPLISEIRNALKRIESGEYVNEEEFFKHSRLQAC